MNSQKKVAFYTLGCKLNFSETSTIARNFQKDNFERVDFEEKADIYVINTCSVTDNADKRFKTIVKSALKKNDEAFLIAIGCYAQLKPEELVKKFPKQIVGVKDSSYNLYENLKIENFSVLPGSEIKLLKALEIGCTGIITATCNVTASLAREVYDDFLNDNKQTKNEKLCNVRKVFDNFNLISGLHSFLAQKNKIYENILPPLGLLNSSDRKKLIENLKKLGFNLEKSKAA